MNTNDMISPFSSSASPISRLVSDPILAKKILKSCSNLKKYDKHNRFISTSVTFTAIDRSGSIPYNQTKPHKIGKLRVPLLKSPSHLGHFSSRVNRIYNEDKYSAYVLNLPNDRTVFNFTVFDGHGGDQCSTYLLKHLSNEIECANTLADPKNEAERDELVEKYLKNIGGYWKRWFKQRKENFAKMETIANEIKLKNLEFQADDFNTRIPLTYLKTDYDFFEQDDNSSGSTCTSAFIETIYSEPGSFAPVFEPYYFNRKTISKLTISHVGDTKAILVDRTGEAHALSQPHHPSNPIEAARLRRFSTNFFMTDSFGEERFIALANTRSFGDVNYKQMGVTSEPDLSQFIIGDAELIQQKLTADEMKKYTIGGLGGDEAFLVLCSDGITNELTDQEVADIVMVHFNMKGHPKATPQLCAEEVVKFVEYVGGDDNATCLVIRLNGWGKWPILDRTGELRQERMEAYTPRGER